MVLEGQSCMVFMLCAYIDVCILFGNLEMEEFENPTIRLAGM